MGIAGDWLPRGASPLASHNREPIFRYSQPWMAGVLVQGEVAACEGERHTETPPSQSLHCILHVALYTGRASLPMAGISSPRMTVVSLDLAW